MFTGGTTGRPKGAILTHKGMLWNIICVTTENESPSSDDTIYYPMQMYHTAALSRFLAYMYAGGTFIGSKSFKSGTPTWIWWERNGQLLSRVIPPSFGCSLRPNSSVPGTPPP